MYLETDEEIIERLRVRFQILEDMSRAVKSGKVRAMIVSGAPGVGKSFGVEKVLSLHDVFATIAQDQSLKKYEVVKGAITELGLYAKLYNYRHDKNVLVFDDCDSIFESVLSLNILKAALDSGENRTIHWNADSYKLKDEGIPNKFDFRGGIIFITNTDFDHVRSRVLRSHLEALASRSHYLDLTIHNDHEKMLRIKQVVTDGMLDRYNLSDASKDELVQYICDNRSSLREFSLRTVLKAADLCASFPDKWMSFAEATLMRTAKRAS